VEQVEPAYILSVCQTKASGGHPDSGKHTGLRHTETHLIVVQVQFSSQNNVSFMTIGGGHGYSGRLGALNGIQIDMGNFDQVSVEASKHQLTIGGSVRYRDISPLVYDAGKATGEHS